MRWSDVAEKDQIASQKRCVAADALFPSAESLRDHYLSLPRAPFCATCVPATQSVDVGTDNLFAWRWPLASECKPRTTTQLNTAALSRTLHRFRAGGTCAAAGVE
jgi:hypothetical protein